LSVNRTAGIPATHARHDRLLVSRFAAGDEYPGEAEQARALVAACAECAGLAQDILALSSAAAQLGAPGRPRDFRITPEQADRLRGSTFERLLRRIAAPGLAPARPLAGVALSVGLMMAVAGAALPAAGGPMDDMTFQRAGAEGVPMATADYGEPAAQPWPEATKDAETTNGAEQPRDVTPSDDRPVLVEEDSYAAAADMREPLVFGGLVIALASLGVLLLILLARRRVQDPLLR
jgi:hypothetical protein